MRPVTKGAALHYRDGDRYQNARPGLLARIGFYCSYCERLLQTGLQVEHVRAHIQGGPDTWSNYLLACPNCNATKKDRDLEYGRWLIPDRDNTARAYCYRVDGVIEVRKALSAAESDLAEATLSLVGLNTELTPALDDAGNTVPLDRRKQRLEAWLKAQRYRSYWERNPTNAMLREAVLDLAETLGFFSIWMEAFVDVPEMRRLLIERFAGTEKGCFDPVTTEAAGRHPNPDRLPAGGKL